MKLFINRFLNLVKGTISGFDHIVFKSLVLPLMSASKVLNFQIPWEVQKKELKI